MNRDTTHQSADQNSKQSFSITALDMQLMGQAIVEHLQFESNYLDRVIACGNQISDLLNKSTFASSRQAPQSGSGEASHGEASGFHDLQVELLQQAGMVSAGRTSLISTLAKLATPEGQPTLSELAPHMSQTVRTNLLRLRNEIRNKLHEAQAITVGNQAVLTYTLDFYHRLLTGFTGETRSAHSYNASGQMAPASAGHLVETNC